MSLLIKAGVLCGYVALSIAGLYHMKNAAQILSLQFALGFTCYVLGFGVWIVILRLYPLSLAFPLAAGALVVGTQLVGWLMLGETIGAHRLAGAGLILAGLAVLALFEPGA